MGNSSVIKGLSLALALSVGAGHALAITCLQNSGRRPGNCNHGIRGWVPASITTWVQVSGRITPCLRWRRSVAKRR